MDDQEELDKSHPRLQEPAAGVLVITKNGTSKMTTVAAWYIMVASPPEVVLENRI